MLRVRAIGVSIIYNIEPMSVQYLHVFEFVDSDRHVSRLVGAAVEIAVVLGQKVDVVEDVARVVGLFTRLRVADVHQHRSVEPGRQSLKYRTTSNWASIGVYKRCSN